MFKMYFDSQCIYNNFKPRNERYNELWYTPDGATAIRVIKFMRCRGRHWQPKQKQTWDAVLRIQMQ